VSHLYMVHAGRKELAQRGQAQLRITRMESISLCHVLHSTWASTAPTDTRSLTIVRSSVPASTRLASVRVSVVVATWACPANCCLLRGRRDERAGRRQQSDWATSHSRQRRYTPSRPARSFVCAVQSVLVQRRVAGSPASLQQWWAKVEEKSKNRARDARSPPRRWHLKAVLVGCRCRRTSTLAPSDRSTSCRLAATPSVNLRCCRCSIEPFGYAAHPRERNTHPCSSRPDYLLPPVLVRRHGRTG